MAFGGKRDDLVARFMKGGKMNAAEKVDLSIVLDAKQC